MLQRVGKHERILRRTEWPEAFVHIDDLALVAVWHCIYWVAIVVAYVAADGGAYVRVEDGDARIAVDARG